MKKILWSALALCVLLAAAEIVAPNAGAQVQTRGPACGRRCDRPPPARSPRSPTGRKKRVAIFDFDFATVQSSSAAVFGTERGHRQGHFRSSGEISSYRTAPTR